ncbi:hypothetical protein EVG20_g6348 [Dentipellis fragilis]|uniref:Uncharacterized protein n=1 Tax=Dentipellis fragilis TaxID=205917 RepID=A0A4Y9YPB1_9AGAM|nr:hypothetical protein EVG20_g6348 [Dentipellis fragilis]
MVPPRISTPAAPDSPRSSQSPPPVGVQGDLELELLGLANALYNLGTTVVNDSAKEKDKVGGGKQVGVRVNEVIGHLSTIGDMAQHVQTMIPMQVLIDIDNGRNPMHLTKDRLERAATENQFMNGKITAIESYRSLLDEALLQSFPELTELVPSSNSEQGMMVVDSSYGESNAPTMNGVYHPFSEQAFVVLRTSIMSEILSSYTGLTSSSPRSDVTSVLHTIIDTPALSIDERNRKELVVALLNDLNGSCKSHDNCRLTVRGASSPRCSTNSISLKPSCKRPDSALALSALKALGKHPAGAAVLASPKNLSILSLLARALKDDFDASCEALRCIANTMLLIESARTTWISDAVKGGEDAVQLLQKSSAPDHIFLASRILFLCTVSSASSGAYIISLVEDKPSGRNKTIVEIIGMRLDTLTTNILGGVKMAREAMTDLLKFTYNLLAHYPKITDCEKVTDLGAGEGKVISEYWSDRLDGILPPLLRAFNTLPPTFPSPLSTPLTHVIHNLTALPITPNLRPLWLPSPTGSPQRSGSNSNADSPVLSNDSKLSPSGEPSPAKGAIDRALHMLSAGRRSLSSRPSSPSPAITSYDTLLRAYDLLEVSFSHFFPANVDVDAKTVRQRAQEESEGTLDDLLCPLVLLITKVVLADQGARARVKEWILPANLDRTGSALEARPDLLGRCLRLLASVYHARLKDATGEMLFAICGSDASTLASQVGYGNVAGFLFNKGIMGAPPPPQPAAGDAAPSETPSGVPINPITGVAQDDRPTVEMTEEEKEQEAERLFVLFDRLERTGALPPNQNPIRKAFQEGRFG